MNTIVHKLRTRCVVKSGLLIQSLTAAELRLEATRRLKRVNTSRRDGRGADIVLRYVGSMQVVPAYQLYTRKDTRPRSDYFENRTNIPNPQCRRRSYGHGSFWRGIPIMGLNSKVCGREVWNNAHKQSNVTQLFIITSFWPRHVQYNLA